jgi:hypothetical protein
VAFGNVGFMSEGLAGHAATAAEVAYPGAEGKEEILARKQGNAVEREFCVNGGK